MARLLGLTFLLALAGFGYVYVSNTAFRQTMQGMLAGVDPKAAFGGRDAVTLMVLGKDEDRNNRDQVMKTNARSDSIILARLDFRAKTIQMLNIPRDTRVHIPGTRGYSKINAAHSIGGPERTAETIHDFLGVTPDTSLVVDYKLLQHAIDAIGGVTVNVDKPLDYDDDWGNLHIHLKPGMQTLNGRDAMGFVRFRHANSGGGDSDMVRIARQQSLLQAVKAKLHEPATWVRIPAVLEIVRREMRGTLRYSQLVALANFARSVPKENVAMHILPNRPGRVYVYAEREAARELVARLFPTDSNARIGSDTRLTEAPRTRRSRRSRRAAPAAVQTEPAPATVEQPAAAATPTESSASEVVSPSSSQGTVTVEAAPEPAAPEPQAAAEATPAPAPEPKDPAPQQTPG